MAQRAKYMIWLTATLLSITSLSPSTAQAQSFSVSPAELRIDNISPGKKAELNFTIHNKDNASHIFILSTYKPEESQRRARRTEFPNDSWISLSPQETEVAASSHARVKVNIAIPPDIEWAGKDWEIWLGVTPESTNILVANCYIRLLVSTGGEVKTGPNTGLIAGIIAGLLLLGCAVYYSKHRAKRG